MSTPADETPQPIATAAAAPAPKKQSETVETIRFLLKLALVVYIFRSLVFSPFSIPSESMLPRLYIGDYLFISKWNYGYSRWSLPWGFPPIPGRLFASNPARGDVVVFRGPPANDHDVIKRVIGLPGDTIQMRAGQVILNGRAVPKVRIADFTLPLSPNYDAQRCGAPFVDRAADGTPICRYKRFRETLPNGKSYDVLDMATTIVDDTEVYSVPAGHVFLMGDNRDNSEDSRFSQDAGGFGYVPMENIEGKAVVSFWSTDGSAQWLLPWTWFTAARWSRIGRGSSVSDLAAWLAALLGQAPGELAPYQRALTHGSHAGDSYERLEFLGDRVLGLVVAEWLYEAFPDEPEGQLSKRFNALVTGPVCADVARGLGVPAHLRLGKQARDDGAAHSDNVLGDVMEALLGAFYREAGLDAARALIRRLWADRLHADAAAPQHPKSALQEWAAANRRKPPVYDLLARAGPGHAPRFTVRASIPNLADTTAEGASKQEAETAAAATLLAAVSAPAPRKRKSA